MLERALGAVLELATDDIVDTDDEDDFDRTSTAPLAFDSKRSLSDGLFLFLLDSDGAVA